MPRSPWRIIPLLSLVWNIRSSLAWLEQLPVRHAVTFLQTRHQQRSALAAATDLSQGEGNLKIEEAIRFCNIKREDVTIEWKPGRIVVTVAADAVYLSNDEISAEDQGLIIIDHEEDSDKDMLMNMEDTTEEGRVDLTILARAINVALEDTMIAETYEIEVTTPGVDDELRGHRMWKAYRGFDVIASYEHPKSNKLQTLEGRLVERNDEHTILNIKGQMRKLQNEKLQSVKLPKAKREKGS